MTLALAPDLIETPHVLPLPGVPLSPRKAKLRGEIVGRLGNLVADFENPETLKHWNIGLYEQFRPRNSWQDWLVQQAALSMMRINRSDRIERRLRDLQALRAIDCWDLDQTQAAHALGANLAADPKRTVAALWCTPAGCDWMIGKWEALAATPAVDWTEAQAALAQQLNPAPVEHHQTPGYARMWITNLGVMRDRLRTADDSFRGLVETDLSPEPSTMLVKLRRYTRSLHRQLQWFIAQLRIEPPKHNADLRFHPDYAEIMAQSAAEDAARVAELHVTARTNPLQDHEETARTNPMQDHDRITRTNPLQDREETARTNPLQVHEELVRTNPLQDHDPIARTNPLQDHDPIARTNPLQDREETARTNPLPDHDRIARTNPLPDHEETARTNPLPDHDRIARTNPL